MAEKTLNKLKNTALNYASTALLRVELAAEESKLKKHFQALGQKLHGAVRDDLLNTIKDDPSVVEILGAIEAGGLFLRLKAKIKKPNNSDSYLNHSVSMEKQNEKIHI